MTLPPPRVERPESVRYRRAFIALLLVAISLTFVMMVRGFILAVFLAAIFAGLAHPLYSWILARTGNRTGIASFLTIIVLLLGIAVPVGSFLTVVVAQAVQVAQWIGQWLENPNERVEQLRILAEGVPFVGQFVPDAQALAQGLRDVAGRVGSFALGTVTGAARGTASFVLQAFVLLYALFFFLRTGADTLRGALAHLPLSPSEEEQLLERFLSVARATLKGSLLIGVIQGGTAGVAFWVAGVPGAAFWGAVMVFFSILPAVGAGLVWVPAVAYLLLTGKIVAGVLLAIWCALVVGTLDNLLRPYLIGRDARMSDLMIFLSTLGGLALFGAVGFIAGPIVAALFVTVWQIYGEAFQDWLPAELSPRSEASMSPPGPPGQGPPAGSGPLGG